MKALILAAVIIFSSIPVFAKDGAAREDDLWISSGAETAMYSISGIIFGGSLAMAYGSGASTGLKASVFIDPEHDLNVLEFNFLFRLYFSGKTSCSGPFIQFTGGPVLFFQPGSGAVFPAKVGSVSAGISLGWRILLGNIFFIETSVRGGYPYITGADFSAGMRFLSQGKNTDEE